MANIGMWQAPPGAYLYVNKNRTRVVPEDSTEAAFVLCGPGGEIPVKLAERYGLVGHEPEPEAIAPEATSDTPEAPAESEGPVSPADPTDAAPAESEPEAAPKTRRR